jgi:hypothetical protein
MRPILCHLHLTDNPDSHQVALCDGNQSALASVKMPFISKGVINHFVVQVGNAELAADPILWVIHKT